MFQNHNDPEYSSLEVDPIMSKISQPPLIELLNRSQYPKHDKIRFDLLKWLINDEKLKDLNLESIPKNIFHDILVLIHMVNEQFIDVAEADIIFLSIKKVEDNNVPENLKKPEILHPRAFFVSYLFSFCHFYITRCLEVTGLKELVVKSYIILKFQYISHYLTFTENSQFRWCALPQSLCKTSKSIT